MNTRNEAEIQEAKEELIKQKPLVLAYVIDEVQDKMINEEAALAVIWSGEAICAKWENEDLEYVVPKEGSNIWVDAMAILKDSEHKKEAEMFINFMSQTDIAKLNADYVGYSTVHSEAKKMLDEDWQNDPAAFPPKEVIDNCEFFKYDQETVNIYDRVWTEIMAK